MVYIRWYFMHSFWALSNFVFAQDSKLPMVAIPDLNGLLNVRDFCISDDQLEVYFTLQSQQQDISRIACIQKAKRGLENPQLLTFSSRYNDLEPFLSPDQHRLYFASNRPLSGLIGPAKDFDIWYVQRQSLQEGWGIPQRLDSTVNSVDDEFYPCVTSSGNLYFTRDSKNGLGHDDLYICKWSNGHYKTAELLDTIINSSGYEFNAFVSRDESTLIYTRYNVPGGLGSGDLYISHRDQCGNWTSPKNLGAPINSAAMDYCPYYDETNGTLYFTSRKNQLIQKEWSHWKEMIDYISKDANGCSKVYSLKYQLPEHK